MNSSAKSRRRPRILVVGSINMDLVVRSHRLPLPGETLTGTSLRQIPGGKGANQAVAAARLGADVAMIGRVGDDAFGDTLRTGLHAGSITTTAIQTTEDCCSGVALIGVEDSGQNCITVIPGANGRLTSNDVRRFETAFEVADILLVQLEVPVTTVLTAMELARQKNVRIILDPAPAVSGYFPELLDVDVVCPNESEAGVLTGIEVCSVKDADAAAIRLCELGARNAIVTLGANGAVVCGQDRTVRHVLGFSVSVVDTTAAGDAFAAALAVGLAEGNSLEESVRFACAAGAVAASREGAQPGMPTRDAIEALILRS